MLRAFEMLLVFGSSWPFFNNPWLGHWSAFMAIVAIIISISIYQKYGLAPALCVAWTICSGMMVFLNPGRNSELGAQLAQSFDNVALSATLSFVLLVVVALLCTRKGLENIEESFAGACIANTLLVFYQFFRGFPAGGFIGNPSMNGCLIAMTYPLLVMKPELNLYDSLSLSKAFKFHWVRIIWDILCVAGPIAAVFMSKASVPVATMGVVMATMFLFSDGVSRSLNTIGKRLSVATSILGAMAVMGFMVIPDFSASSGRYAIWRESYKWFEQNANIWTGSGLGSFFLWGPFIQNQADLGRGNWWIWAHNDPLQCLIETGAIGLALYAWLILDTSIRYYTVQKKYLLVCLCGYLFSSFFNFPSHIAATSLFLVVILARLRSKE